LRAVQHRRHHLEQECGGRSERRKADNHLGHAVAPKRGLRVG
jgi:hypothetical protein